MYRIRAIYITRDGSHFNKDYYLKHHISLARKQTQGHVQIKSMDVEWDVQHLLNGKSVQSPCTLSIYLESLQDVEAFKMFLQGEHAAPLMEDVQNYTNCDLEWTIAELIVL